jgi:predicted nucleotide-binding protein
MMIGMALRELASDLKDVAGRLAAVAADGDNPAISGPVEAGMDACSRVERAWSGSWLGYQSRVYYADFAPPPPGARFDSEWGAMPAFGNSTRGDWREYRYEDVTDAIEKIAGNPDFSAAQDYEKRARAAFEDGKASVVSILTTALSIRDDPLVREALDEAKSTEPFTQSGVVLMLMPKGGIMSRDAAAMNEGFAAPAHIAYRAGMVQMTDPGRRCGDLGKLAHRMADHLGRMSETDVRPARSGNRVFIGHGRSPAWRDLKDFLQDRLHLDWEEFNRVPVAGVWTGDRLSSMLDNASMAFLVCTAEDEHADSSQHARENVIHEAGLFQGRLGFERAIILLEEGCAEFSNIHGLGQIRFPKGNISAKFEEIRTVLEREGIIPPASLSRQRTRQLLTT